MAEPHAADAVRSLSLTRRHLLKLPSFLLMVASTISFTLIFVKAMPPFILLPSSD